MPHISTSDIVVCGSQLVGSLLRRKFRQGSQSSTGNSTVRMS